MVYVSSTPQEIAYDFIEVRGDWYETTVPGHTRLTAALRQKALAPILELHDGVSDPGIGIKRCKQRCRDEVTGAIHEFPCPTYRAAQ